MTASDFTPPQVRQFWAKVRVLDLLSCWEWQGWCNDNGYGIKTIRHSVDIRAHRIAYCLTAGELDDRLEVLHSCDNPPCCNPAHLIAGTHLDNMRDMIAKGRNATGQQSGRNTKPESYAVGQDCSWAKLTEQMVREIRNSPLSSSKLSLIYKVSPKAIRKVRSRETWAHLK